jgi:arginine-tRNA-protein transferase
VAISHRLRLLPTQPPELLVYDETSECNYLPGRDWRLPLRLPVRSLGRAELDVRLASGDRRQGRLLYRASCPSCQACEPIRIEVGRFAPSRTQRRIHRAGKRRIETDLGPLVVDDERVRLYNLHKHGRNLARDEHDVSGEAYRLFLGESCCETFEMRYLVDERLIGVAIADRGAEALSAVYFYWDPAFAALSPGTFSILEQIELCRRWGMRWLYLGLYIAECSPMSYKNRFHPHERLIGDAWRRFER